MISKALKISNTTNIIAKARAIREELSYYRDNNITNYCRIRFYGYSTDSTRRIEVP